MSTSPRIILTGASRGLGLAVLRILLTKHNARVATLSRSLPAELQAIQGEYSDRVLVVQGDVGTIDDNDRIVKSTVEKWGGIDGVILNAGSISLQKVGELQVDEISPYVNSNLSSILYLLKPALPHLRETRGKIVMVSSGASTGAYTAWGLYCIGKAGMNSIARTIAVEEKETGVGVWSIRPGMIDTSMQEYLRKDGHAHMPPAELEKFTGAHEQGKLLKPEQPGAVIAGLATTDQPPMDVNGQYLDWQDEKFAAFRSA